MQTPESGNTFSYALMGLRLLWPQVWQLVIRCLGAYGPSQQPAARGSGLYCLGTAPEGAPSGFVSYQRTFDEFLEKSKLLRNYRVNIIANINNCLSFR